MGLLNLGFLANGIARLRQSFSFSEVKARQI
jgi:hypothetical protein